MIIYYIIISTDLTTTYAREGGLWTVLLHDLRTITPCSRSKGRYKGHTAVFKLSDFLLKQRSFQTRLPCQIQLFQPKTFYQ